MKLQKRFPSACVVAVSMRLNTFHAIDQKPKMRQPIGIHVSPGEIAEEVSVCLCSAGEYEVKHLSCYWPEAKDETANRNSRVTW